MAIEVRHGTSAAATAAAALGGAQAKSRQRAALGGARAATQIELANQRIAAQSKLTQEGRQFAAGQAQLGHERGLERQEAAAGFQQEAAVAAQGRRRSDFELRLTTKQDADIRQLDEALAAAMVNPDLSPEDLAEVKRRIHAGLFEIRLFNDDLAAIFKAQGEILRHNVSYVGLTLVPAAWMLVPFVLIAAHRTDAGILKHVQIVEGIDESVDVLQAQSLPLQDQPSRA